MMMMMMKMYLSNNNVFFNILIMKALSGYTAQWEGFGSE